MPTICTMRGIIITMYYDDHNPPHFHARFGDDKALVHIDPAQIAEGSLPRPQAKIVLDWAERRKNELLVDWALAAQQQPLNPIQP